MPLLPNDTPLQVTSEGVEFGMLDGRKGVRCSVETAALEDKEQAFGSDYAALLAIFERHRHEIEAIAGDLYDAGFEPRVTTKLLAG